MATLRTLSIDEFKSAYDKVKDDAIQQEQFLTSINFNHCQLIYALMDLRSQTTPENFEQHDLYPIILSKLKSVSEILVLKNQRNVYKLIKDKPISVKLEIINKNLSRLKEWVSILNNIENVQPYLPTDDNHIYYLSQYAEIYNLMYEDTKWTKDYYYNEYQAFNFPIHHRVKESIEDFSFKVWRQRVMDEAPDALEEKLFYFISIKNDIPNNYENENNEVSKTTNPIYLANEDRIDGTLHDKVNHVDTFKEFINYQIESIKKQIEAAHSKPAILNHKQQNERMKTSLSVPELALLFKMLSELKPDIFMVDSKEDLFRFISSNFATKKSSDDGISVAKLRTLFATPEMKSFDIWEQHFRTILVEMKKIKEKLSE